MVSSGQVTSDASSVTSNFSNYNSSVSGVAGSWQGPSFDSFNSQAASFVSEFQSTIEGQLASFASAVSGYEQYQDLRGHLNTAKQNLATAQNAKDSANISKYSGQVSSYESQMNTLKGQIESDLASAKSTTLEATALNGGAALGEFINYYQYNYGDPYGGGTIASWGCGPTSLAMVLTYLKGEEITPQETAALGNGDYTCSEGTLWSYFPAMAERYGVQCEQQDVTPDNIYADLEAGKPIIVSMAPGHFTSSGHFIVLRGVTDDGQIIVADPASEERSNTTWDVNIICNEGRSQWAMSN